MNGIGLLTSKAILGFYFLALEQNLGLAWVPKVSNAVPFISNEDSETYGWLGQVPQLREWVGGREAKGLKDYSYSISNVDYESTLDFKLKDLRQDKTGQLQLKINEQVGRAESHWAGLLTTLIEDGESNTCYDGEYFFDTDHPVAESTASSTTASNDLTNSIVLKTAPTVAEMAAAIFATIQAMMAFVDDQNEPMNSEATSFMVMVPVPFMQVAMAAIKDTVIQGSSGTKDNTLVNQDAFTVEVVVNPRLSWTDKFAIFRTDSQVAPLIRQEEEPLTVSAKAEGSEYEHDFKRHQYGLRTSRGAGYGFWQFACLRTFTTT